MAESNGANTMPKGTTLVFGSLAYTADGSGIFPSHLIMHKEPESKSHNQHAETGDAAGFDENQAPPKLDLPRECQLQLTFTS